MTIYKNGYLNVDSVLQREWPSSRCLFALPQYQVHKAADEGEGKGHPRQDEGVAVRALRGLRIEVRVLAVKFLASVCVNGSCYHDGQACQKKAKMPINHGPVCPRYLRGQWPEPKTHFSFYYYKHLF